MATVYFMMGLPGSGKSTYLKNNLKDLPVLSRDIIRAELGYTKSPEQKRILPIHAEEEVSKHQREVVDYYCSANIDFVIDDTNNRFANRKTLLNIIHRYPTCKTVAIFLQTDLETCVERRRGQIKRDVMVKLYNLFEEPQPNEFDEVICIASQNK